jgi:hypothetical protein
MNEAVRQGYRRDIGGGKTAEWYRALNVFKIELCYVGSIMLFDV